MTCTILYPLTTSPCYQAYCSLSDAELLAWSSLISWSILALSFLISSNLALSSSVLTLMFSDERKPPITYDCFISLCWGTEMTWGLINAISSLIKNHVKMWDLLRSSLEFLNLSVLGLGFSLREIRLLMLRLNCSCRCSTMKDYMNWWILPDVRWLSCSYVGRRSRGGRRNGDLQLEVHLLLLV